MCFPCWADVECDGTDDTIQISDSSSLALTSSWTYALWMKRTAIDNAVAESFVSHWNSTSAGRQILIYFTTGGNVNKIQVDIPFIANILTSTNEVDDTSLHHIAVTKSGNDWVIYVDGASDGSVTDATAQENSTAVLSICNDIVTPQFTSIIISEYSAWNIALSATEISQLYIGGLRRLPLQIQSSKLVLDLSLDDVPDGQNADGRTFRDLSGNGNDATGDDGANNTGMTGLAGRLTYQ